MTDDPRHRTPEAAPDPVTVTDADLFEGRSPLDPEASFDARPAPVSYPHLRAHETRR
ncbi:hypothetical protein HET68_25495, partial [Streptomyces sp. McG8]|nr:hypothetical protein [Streptomyces sp. McG8]